jgi:uncharacterized protein YegP (UPF0339 family)
MSDMSINDFVKSMKDAGFTFKYRATNGEMVINGEVKASGETVAKQSKTSAQSRQEIKNLFKQGK